MTEQRVLVIYNPTNRSQVQNDQWMGETVCQLNRAGHFSVTFFPTTAETQARDLIHLLDERLKLVIAAGGDGTIRLVLAAMAIAQTAIPAAIFPIGTGNVLARNLGIVEPELLANPLEHIYEYLTTGVPARIDMGMMNGEFFAGMAGVGPLSDAFMLPERSAKTQSKLVAYMKTLLATIAMPPRIFKITTFGRSFRVQASGVFVSNVEDLGIGRPPNPQLLQDGYLDLHIIHPQKAKDYIDLTRRYGAGNLDGTTADCILRVKEAVVEMIPRRGIQSAFQCFANKMYKLFSGKAFAHAPRGEQMPCMIDGDAHSVTPMRVTVIPRAVTVLIPREAASNVDLSLPAAPAEKAARRLSAVDSINKHKLPPASSQ